MNNIERLIALDYLKKRIEREMKELRPDVMAHYRDRMAHEVDSYGDPKRSFGYYLDGEKVTAFWFSQSREEPERRTLKATCYDWGAVLADDNEEFAEWLAAYVKNHIGELAERYVTETGDSLDGVYVEEVVEPARPARIDPKGRFRINANKMEALMPQLKGYVAGLLEGGN